MTTGKSSGTVVDLRADGTLNVALDGGLLNAVRYPSWYAPRIGDTVIIDWVGTQAYVDTCLTPGRLVQPVIPVPQVIVSDSLPGAGWDTITGGSLYVRTGGTDLWLVRITEGTAPEVVETITASGSGTWDPTNGWRLDDAKPRQGDWAGDGSGTSTGLWFYPTITPPSGRVLTRAQMTVVRDNRGGRSWGPMQLHLYLHSHTSPPGGQPAVDNGPLDLGGATPALGAAVTFDLPLDYAGTLITGARKGLGIFSPDYSQYLICVGPDVDPRSGQLTLTYT